MTEIIQKSGGMQLLAEIMEAGDSWRVFMINGPVGRAL